MILNRVSFASLILLFLLVGVISVPVFAQGDLPRQTVAVTYPLDETVNVKFRGTTLLPRLKGEAKVKRAGRRGTRVELAIDNLTRASELGGIYTTFVLWAIAPDGRVDNLGEIKRSGSALVDSKLDVTTNLQTFAMIITAEPHFLMKVPSRMVVLENLPPQLLSGSNIETVNVQYIGNSADYFRDARVPELADPDFKTTPVSLLGARQSVNLAKFAGAAGDAPDELRQAEADLQAAERAWRVDQASAEVDVLARKATSAGARAEEMAVARKASRLRREDISRRDAALRSAERTAENAQREIDQLRAALDRESRARELAERDLGAATEQLREQRSEVARLRDELQAVRSEGDNARIRLARIEGERQAEVARREAEVRDQKSREALATLKQTLAKFGTVKETTNGFQLVLPESMWTGARAATLSSAMAAKLEPLAALLASNPDLQILIEVFTDNKGDEVSLQQLTQDRARVLSERLQTAGVEPSRIQANGMGAANPVSSNKTVAGRGTDAPKSPSAPQPRGLLVVNSSGALVVGLEAYAEGVRASLRLKPRPTLPMSPLEVLQLIGYSIGAALPLWMGFQLFSRRHHLTTLERLLFALALTMGGWHTSNLFITVHSLFGFDSNQWALALRIADSVAVVSITFAYSFLLHVHLHLWAHANGRTLTRTERIRVYLSYIPTLFLFIAVPSIWSGAYAPMLAKVRFFVFPFALWIAYVLGLIAFTELLIARKASNRSEQRIMRTLAFSFVGIGILILAALALGLGEGTTAGLYLQTLANLGSLLPSALLAYYIYRYRYLELIIEESLIVATFAAVVLTIYLYGIRSVGDWITARYGVKPGVVEALLILALTLVAAPLRGWLQDRFRKLFDRETALYREIVGRIGSQPGQYKQLPELLRFVEKRTEQALNLRRVQIMVAVNSANQSSSNSEAFEPWIEQVLESSKVNKWQPVADDSVLEEHNFQIAFPVRREEAIYGALLVEASSASLTNDARAVLEVLAQQVAIAIEDSRLVQENVRLERQVAEGERLAALGQMAATVAHEIKNPLSAIKSIAQVMKEESGLSVAYARDLSLIVGETDRLSQSVTQLLSFARRQSAEPLPIAIDELIMSVVGLFRAQAEQQKITVSARVEAEAILRGVMVPALRDALSNLVLNALQVTPAGGRITITAETEADQVVILVEDSGPGIPVTLKERIWEPFFTTKQRGTGLGLAIVRKRMEEAGGSARLSASPGGGGARFELRLPLPVSTSSSPVRFQSPKVVNS